MKKWCGRHARQAPSVFRDSVLTMLGCRFERWQAEKIKRQKAGLPAIVEYRHETYVSTWTLSEEGEKALKHVMRLRLPLAQSRHAVVTLTLDWFSAGDRWLAILRSTPCADSHLL
jgi:hypothetical protein